MSSLDVMKCLSELKNFDLKVIAPSGRLPLVWI